MDRDRSSIFGASWYDGVAFCRWLGHQTGFAEANQAYESPESLKEKEYPRESSPSENWAPRDWPVRLSRPGFRLPTEAEWEVAARAGTTTAFAFGNDYSVLKEYGHFSADNGSRRPQAPRSLRPNAKGMFDMHGNVSEWCHDAYSQLADGNVEDPVGPEKGGTRVVRGGGFTSASHFLRSSSRSSTPAERRGNSIGLRIAMTLPEAGAVPTIGE